jgi:hypothetical protein
MVMMAPFGHKEKKYNALGKIQKRCTIGATGMVNHKNYPLPGARSTKVGKIT